MPLWALVATTVVAALCFFSFIFSPKAVYVWLLNTSGMTGFIAWLGIAISHYRFRRGYVAQGRNLADLPYVSPFFPFGPIFAFALCLIITLGQNYQAFLQDRIDWGGVVATYVGIPLFLLLAGLACLCAVRASSVTATCAFRMRGRAASTWIRRARRRVTKRADQQAPAPSRREGAGIAASSQPAT